MAQARDEISDEALMAAVREGDAQAFSALLRRHVERVRAIGWRLLGSAAAADDLAQEVFLRIWQHPEKFDPARGRFVHWLARVAANLATDRLRRKRAEPMDMAGMAERLHDPRPDPETAAMRAQRAQRVRAAIARLPERQRLAITLAHDLGHANAEIAHIMDISVEAVESLLARGRRRLKELLREELSGDDDVRGNGRKGR